MIYGGNSMDAENLLHLAECDFKVCTNLEKQFP